LWLALPLVLGVALLGYALWRDRPDYYDPTRTTLVEAERLLTRSFDRYQQQLDLREEIREAHMLLREAIADLEQAQRTDAEDRTQIQAIRSRLQDLEDEGQAPRMTPADLRRTYRELLAQLEALIDKQGRR
jgi:hypothetical protein